MRYRGREKRKNHTQQENGDRGDGEEFVGFNCERTAGEEGCEKRSLKIVMGNK